MKVFINVPFEEKNQVKELGARWDNDIKSWYIPESLDKELFKKWKQHDPSKIDKKDQNLKKIYLKVSFAEKDLVKNEGGRWDNEQKKWYFLSNMDIKKFEKWLDIENKLENNKTNNKNVPNDLTNELEDILKLEDN